MRRILLIVAVLLAALPARAAEEITRFHSRVTIHDDATITVTETIDVTVEGREIRRGILRDIPLTRSAPDGAQWRAPVSPVSVTMDGAAVRWSVEHPAEGLLRIRIGSPDILLGHGPHRYVLTYRSGAQVRPFPTHDELWWNVTGEDWTFPILRAEAEVSLPGGATVSRLAAYTGPRFTRESTAVMWGLGTARARVEALRTLAPGEGLTVVVAFPKGHVVFPPPGSEAAMPPPARILGLPAYGAMALAMVLLASVAGGLWWRFGKDPAGRPIMPRFSPPPGLPPASCRFIRTMRYDRETLAAGLLGLIAKRRLALLARHPDLVFARRDPADALPDAEAWASDEAERRLLGALPPGTFTASPATSSEDGGLHDARRALGDALDETYARSAFRTNRVLALLCAALAVALGVLLAQAPMPARSPEVVAALTMLERSVWSLFRTHTWHGMTFSFDIGFLILFVATGAALLLNRAGVL
nr:DUF2207 domain-containing protein [Rubritepida sp.]